MLGSHVGLNTYGYNVRNSVARVSRPETKVDYPVTVYSHQMNSWNANGSCDRPRLEGMCSTSCTWEACVAALRAQLRVRTFCLLLYKRRGHAVNPTRTVYNTTSYPAAGKQNNGAASRKHGSHGPSCTIADCTTSWTFLSIEEVYYYYGIDIRYRYYRWYHSIQDDSYLSAIDNVMQIQVGHIVLVLVLAQGSLR